MKDRIFLGGTCNESNWRNKLIPQLKREYFNPVVSDWTEDCIEIENNEKYNKCNILLFVITREMTGVYSIAEMVESCFLENKMTVYNIVPDGFNEGQLRSLKAVGKIMDKNGALGFVGKDMQRLATILNNQPTNKGIKGKISSVAEMMRKGRLNMMASQAAEKCNFWTGKIGRKY